MPEKMPPKPLIPLEDLKKVIQGLLRVPKAELDKAEAERPKRPRATKNPS
jgi:hypothetical protein